MSYRRCSTYGLYETASPFRTKMGDCPSIPPPTGKVVVLTAVRELTGTGGYRRMDSLMTSSRYFIFLSCAREGCGAPSPSPTTLAISARSLDSTRG